MPWAVKCLNYLSKYHEFYVLCAREDEELPKIKEWLDKHGFPEMEVTNKKRKGTSLFIDDRCYRFTNWKDISKLLK